MHAAPLAFPPAPDADAGRRPHPTDRARHARGQGRVITLSALAALGLVGLLLWQLSPPWSRPADPPAASPAAPAPVARVGGLPAEVRPPPAATTSAPEATTPAVPSAAAPPEGLTAEQWAELQQSLADRPDREAELRRIVGLLRLQRQVETLRDDTSLPPAQRQALARAIQAELPAQLNAGSVSAAEAMQVQAAVLQVLEPDPQRAEAELRAWRERLQLPTAGGVHPNAEAFEQAQRSLLQAYDQLSPEQRQQQPPLEQQLEQLRAQYFDHDAKD